MFDRNTNPPAFPLSPGNVPYYQEGMTLRDWFAGLAMQARLTHAEPCFEDGWAHTAAWAYEAADAMLAERAK